MCIVYGMLRVKSDIRNSLKQCDYLDNDEMLYKVHAINSFSAY